MSSHLKQFSFNRSRITKNNNITALGNMKHYNNHGIVMFRDTMLLPEDASVNNVEQALSSHYI